MTDVVMLAKTWKGRRDISGWWMSEKLDGCRAVWGGEYFYSRDGTRAQSAPGWYRDKLPKGIVLDGELWPGRGKHYDGSGIFRTQYENDDYSKLTFVVFDAPNIKGGFEDRFAAAMESLKSVDCSWIALAEQTRVRDNDHMIERFNKIRDLGGEGLVLRAPLSPYRATRSSLMLKVKPRNDREAKVIGYTEGKGRHAGRMGALICEWDDGTKFKVGSGFMDSERDSPPVVGCTITIEYFEINKSGVPREPRFKRERKDVA